MWCLSVSLNCAHKTRMRVERNLLTVTPIPNIPKHPKKKDPHRLYIIAFVSFGVYMLFCFVFWYTIRCYMVRGVCVLEVFCDTPDDIRKSYIRFERLMRFLIIHTRCANTYTPHTAHDLMVVTINPATRPSHRSALYSRARFQICSNWIQSITLLPPSQTQVIYGKDVCILKPIFNIYILYKLDKEINNHRKNKACKKTHNLIMSPNI